MIRRVFVPPLLALVVVGCGTGTTTPAPAPSATAPVGAAPAGPTGFPGAEDGPVLDAARSFAEKVSTYDHTRLADLRNAVLPLTGEPLKGELTRSLADDGEFATGTKREERNAIGKVLDLGLVDREGNRAVVVLFLDQLTVSPGSGEETQRLRQRVTLNRSRTGAWLAVEIETV